MHGQHPKLPIDLYLGLEPTDEAEGTYDQYVEKLRKDLQMAYMIAGSRIASKVQKNKYLYDKKAKEAELEQGDRVLVRNVSIRGKQKLADKWQHSPYLVVKRVNPNIQVYVLKPEFGGKHKTVHYNLLMPCYALPAIPPDHPMHIPRRQPFRPNTRIQTPTRHTNRAAAAQSDAESESSSSDEDWAQRIRVQ
ncbi:uncharacterized protein [Ptychodera flava]|uniref:uncharacterized protein n=1 Tax=Ptychodera flava TaxID=63121 RepID=UPI003969C94D